MQEKNLKLLRNIAIVAILVLIMIVICLIITKKSKLPQTIGEQAKAQYITTINNQTYDITNAVTEVPNVPNISAGMIPIKKEGENWVITTQQDLNWYDYTQRKPAYMMLNDGTYQSELLVDMTNKKLANEFVENGGTTVTENELGTIYIWIPRFAYNSEGEIIYIKQSCSVAGTWTIPKIFMHETNNKDLSLAGIWIEYSPLTNSSEVKSKIAEMKKEESNYGFIKNTIATNANDETEYLTTINTFITNLVGEEFVNNQNIINYLTNTNRTILKIINTNQLEPIRGTAYYDEMQEKIKIEITYRTNAIVKILDSNGKILSENSTTADTGDEIIGNGKYKYIIIDDNGNIKEIIIKVEGLKIYVIPNLEKLKEFRDEVNAGNTFEGVTVLQTADIQMNEGKYTIDNETRDVIFDEEKEPEQWVPIGTNTSNCFYGTYNGMGHTISGIYIYNGRKL